MANEDHDEKKKYEDISEKMSAIIAVTIFLAIIFMIIAIATS